MSKIPGWLVKTAWFGRNGATFETIRRAFVKIAVHVDELKTCTKLPFPCALPEADVLSAILAAIAVGVPGRGS